uniref:RNaseH n=1 Tax=Ochrobactrum phage ORM_20 TaxID=2985243 RepID=A0A9N6WV54_9VIRU|nr:RNaseH [Ochrobactrum phage ORM_20]
MAILIDWSNVANATTHKALALNEIDQETTSSKILLGKLRQINTEFRGKYGELILCADHRSWRYDRFPEYKGRRKAKREAEEQLEGSIIQEIFAEIHAMWDILNDERLYRTVKAYGAEGDDVMAVLAQKLPGRHLIVSADKDMSQLTRFKNIEVYNPIKKVMVDNGMDYYRLLTLTGDPGDDIPNILSDDDTFMDPNKKQRTLTAKMKAQLMAAVDVEEEIKSMNFKHLPASEVLRNYRRNRDLIDLTMTPQEVVDRIMEEYEKTFKRGSVMNMLVRLQCSEYLSKEDDFWPKIEEENELDIF